MIRLARCVNCRSFNLTRKRVGDGQGSMDTCRDCASSFPHVPGTTLASRVGRRKKKPATSMSFNLSTADVPQSMPAVTLDSRLPSTVHGQPAKYLWRELIRCGDFKHPKDGRAIPVDAVRLNEWSRNFGKMRQAGVKVYVPVNHSSRTEDNRGYVIDMRERDGRLEGLLQLIGADAERDAARSEISVRIVPGFKDGQGTEYSEVIEHASLVVNPVIPNQRAAVAASRGEATEGETYTLSGDGDGHWVTIDGEHVFIGKGGTIEKGPANLVGKKPAQAGDKKTVITSVAHAEAVLKSHGVKEVQLPPGSKYKAQLAVDAVETAKAHGLAPPERFTISGGRAIAYASGQSVGLTRRTITHDLLMRQVETGALSQDNPVLHELAHLHHEASIGPDRYMRLNNWANTNTEHPVAGKVSSYAKVNPKEFVAETASGMMAGKTYSPEVMDLYRRYGGPAIQLKKSKSSTLSRSPAMQLSSEQLAAVRTETGMADLPDDDAGFDRLIKHLQQAKTDKAQALARATAAEAKVTDLSRDKPRSIDPDVLADRADNKVEKIDFLLSRGILSGAQADYLKKRVRPEPGKPSAVMLSRGEEGESPIDIVLKALELGAANGITSQRENAKKNGVELQRSSVQDPGGEPDKKSLMDEGLRIGQAYQEEQLRARGLLPAGK